MRKDLLKIKLQFEIDLWTIKMKEQIRMNLVKELSKAKGLHPDKIKQMKSFKLIDELFDGLNNEIMNYIS